MDIKIHEQLGYKEAHETLCSDCGQLRLSYVDSDQCGNCGSKNIIIGKLGELKKPDSLSGLN